LDVIKIGAIVLSQLTWGIERQPLNVQTCAVVSLTLHCNGKGNVGVETVAMIDMVQLVDVHAMQQIQEEMLEVGNNVFTK